MARRRVAVHPEGFPRMLLQILEEPLKGAPDISIVSSRRADIVIVCDDLPAETKRQLTAQLVIEIDSNGRHMSVIRDGDAPEPLGEYSDVVLLSLVREIEPSDGCSLFGRLFGTKPSSGKTEKSAQQPTQTIDAYFAHLAQRILASSGPAPPNGPRRELVQLAEKVAARSPEGEPALPLGLARISGVFDLSAAEADLVFLASLVEVDPVAARLVGLINDHLLRPRPTIGMLASIGHIPLDVAATFSSGPLTKFALATAEGDGPLITRTIRAHNDVWPVVLGLDRKHPFALADLVEDDSLALPQDRLIELGRVADAMSHVDNKEVLVLVAGDHGVGRSSIAARLARKLCPVVLEVSAQQMANEPETNALSRECALQNAAAVFTDADEIDPDLWARLTKDLGAPIFATTSFEGSGSLALHAARPPIEFTAPRRDRAHRTRMWNAAAPSSLVGTAEDLSERFDFSRQHIASALSLAESTARVQGRSGATPEDLRTACETLRDTRFEGMAERLDCPFAADDIVLAPDTRAELNLATAWARHGTRLFSEGGAGAKLHVGQGLTCLFAGPPGVGKTMAARIIAAEVDYVLYRIDLSEVVDKFIGESEKRLSALFDEAERARVALFFDEADALFGKRTDVRDSHDRYANITVDHLLQRIDDFDGLAILATNLAGNLDDAFLRRIRVRAEFQAPDAPDRRRIWKKLLGDNIADDIDLTRLADPFELVGGEIRNAVYSAHLYAAESGRTIEMQDCVRGLWRELRKVGRVVDPAHLGPWREVVDLQA